MSAKPLVFVAGHTGMVGSAILRRLKTDDRIEVLTATHAELDLTDQHAVDEYFRRRPIAEVYLAAARVGGIHANSHYPAPFIYDNLMIEANVIHAAWRHGVGKLLFLGSSCIYPKFADQPIVEEALLTGTLEATNEPYAIAKIAGIKLCESYHRQYGVDFRSLMPTNLYGPGDNYHPENSHVVPALIRRFHEGRLAAAPAVTIWGSGTPRREFLHVDDLAAASVHLMGVEASRYAALTTPTRRHLNVGYGSDVTIAELAQAIARVTGYQGAIAFDPEKPDGTPRKLLDSSRMHALGWTARIDLEGGLREAYQDFLARHASGDGQTAPSAKPAVAAQEKA